MFDKMIFILTFLSVSLAFQLATATTCPDGSVCQGNATCCSLSSEMNSYGCCPLPSAVCCSDHKSCCPANNICIVELKLCLKSTRDANGEMKTSITAAKDIERSKRLEDTPCGQGSCPDGTTCCDNVGCCPYPNAICCSDDQHCCPQGTRCDLKSQTCISNDGIVERMMPREPVIKKEKDVRKVKVEDTPCGGGKCPNGTKCCGDVSCCPHQNGVCCSDNAHCCPHLTYCDVKDGLCIGLKGDTDPRMTLVSSPERIKDTPCGAGSCPDGTTCCDNLGCCPLPNAVCCSDDQHCCPQNTICNLQNQTCISSYGKAVPTLKRQPIINVKDEKNLINIEDVPCGAGSCPDGTTCCDNVGCCPYPNAVCCSDDQHCCPNSMRCNLQNQTCDGAQSFLIRPKKKIPARLHKQGLPVMAKDKIKVVICPGAMYYCPDYTTCCILPNGAYGCCPYPSAVCCNDHVHCCPTGTRCDPTSTMCIQQPEETPAFRIV